MTESEAIKELHKIRPRGGIIPQKRAEALDVAIQALDEVKQYREIGTVEECQLATEKYTSKKVISLDYYNGTVNYGCPVCKTKIISKVCGEWCAGKLNEYCDNCGQKLDWGDEE